MPEPTPSNPTRGPVGARRRLAVPAVPVRTPRIRKLPAGRWLPGRPRSSAGPDRSGLVQGIGLAAGIAALAAGGVAAGLELERRIVTKRLAPGLEPSPPPFFTLRADGPALTTPDGVVLHTEVDELPAGQDSELTIVFVHGYALNLDCWHFQRAHLRGRFRLVFYDQRSHGRSSASDAAHSTLDQLADDLVQVLQALVPTGPMVLVGHSMGGMTIQRLARRRPELFGPRILGVALVCTSGGEMSDYSLIRGLPGRTFSRVATPVMATLNKMPDLVRRTRQAGSDLGYVVTRRMSFASDVPSSSVEFMSEMLGTTSLQAVADFYPGFADLDERAGYPALSSVPLVIVGGEQDAVLPVAHTERLIDHLPSAEHEILDPCGHMAMIEYPERINTLLDRLLARV